MVINKWDGKTKGVDDVKERFWGRTNYEILLRIRRVIRMFALSRCIQNSKVPQLFLGRPLREFGVMRSKLSYVRNDL